MSDNFFSRWSRRKQGLETSEPPKPEPIPTRGPTAAATPAESPSAQRAQALQNTADAGRSAKDNATSPPPEPAPPLPTMEDVQHLTPSSDFQSFMQQGVPGEVRNAAMKKLFADPHFNVMDGLDIYIGDYNTPDPLPAGMLEKMVGAEFLNLFPDKAPSTGPQLALGDARVNPEQSPLEPDDTALVAKSLPSTTQPLPDTPMPQASEAIDHDHPDLQLQPNHAPASPSPGQSTG